VADLHSVDVKQIDVAQEMLRHANYSTTANIYQHVSSDEQFAAAQAVQAWIERALG
jgi:integrase